MTTQIDDSARLVDSDVGRSEIREYVTIHDTTVGDGCEIYERCSVKKSSLYDDVVVNAGSYVENAVVDGRVQIGPNCSVVGVTHDLDERGMTFGDDVFERVVLHEGVFLGAGSVVGPGVEIGERTVVAAGAVVTDDVDPGRIVLGSPPTQRVVALRDWL